MLHNFAQDKFDIIIQAGQSNAEGFGFGPTDNPYELDGRVWYLNRDGTISLATERVRNNNIETNFSLAFIREYLNAGKLDEGRQILIIRAAVGGTGFLDGRWGMTDDLYLQMMDMIRTALAFNPENHLVAFLWHQGETDAVCCATFEQHYHHLSNLIRTVRETFNTPNLPFVAGDFVYHWKCFSQYKDACVPVVDAIRAVCRDCGYGGFVETDGLNSNAQEQMENSLGRCDDDIHFSRRATYELGRRYFKKFIELR